jgi:hypothetical protein
MMKFLLAFLTLIMSAVAAPTRSRTVFDPSLPVNVIVPISTTPLSALVDDLITQSAPTKRVAELLTDLERRATLDVNVCTDAKFGGTCQQLTTKGVLHSLPCALRII